MMAKYIPVYELEFAAPNAPAVTAEPGFAMGSDSQNISAQLVAYWTSFVNAGKPVAANVPIWQRYRVNGDVMLFASGETGLYNAAAQHKCNFWKPLCPQILTQ